ncbi:MAG: type I DNA topoisomerase [Actinomycetes bacterium]|jgi:DNA topoisomerase-1|nr:type I DNA topoisomerase [Actinomycetes bacterium]
MSTKTPSSGNLVIVESPAKAKTIERYLGDGFRVLSSVGHIRHIPPGDESAIDIAGGFTAKYEVDPEKKKTVAELKRAVKAADEVWLATDEDREGEAIAWHLAEVLGLDVEHTKRITFHEITKSALEEAIAHPRTINMLRVKSQQARQVLDRLYGYELSPVVWRKVPGGKSAGRVQSPALRLLVEREREINAFTAESSYKVTAVLTHGDEELKGELKRSLDDEDAARALLEQLPDATWTVRDVSVKPAKRNPPAPYTTSTLQQDANSRMGYAARTTMNAAQALYQAGKITYMRTDSTTLSKQALASAADYIKSNFGGPYLHTRQFKTKSAGAQEAHEAIRPTDISVESAGRNQYEKKVYELIRTRTLASQMAPAELEKTTVTIDVSTIEDDFEAKGEAVVFDGFLKVYGRNIEKYLPRLNAGDVLDPCVVTAHQTFSKPPARYTEGSLVKKLEELGIGRPSTYATILDNIKSRGYVQPGEGMAAEREAVELCLDYVENPGQVTREVQIESYGNDKGKLIPTAIGEVLSDFLEKYFTRYVDYGFTAATETELDCIEQGECNPTEMLTEFYGPFHQLIEAAADIDRSTVGKSRVVGIDPATGRDIIARVGRYGPMLQIGSVDDEEKPRFANLPKGRTIDNVTIDEALRMFQLPRVLGSDTDGRDVKANIGRFGPYVQVEKTYASIKAPLDVFTITLDQGLELIEEKRKAEAEKHIASFDDGAIQVLKGRYGPYVTDGNKNAKVPKDVDPTTIDEEMAREMLAKAPEKKGRGRKTATKKTAAKKKAPKKK